MNLFQILNHFAIIILHDWRNFMSKVQLCINLAYTYNLIKIIDIFSMNYLQYAQDLFYLIFPQMPLLEWFANNYKTFGAALEIITDRSQEGSQFCRGFGGIGGLLRYKVDFQDMEYESDDNDLFDDDIF